MGHQVPVNGRLLPRDLVEQRQACFLRIVVIWTRKMPSFMALVMAQNLCCCLALNLRIIPWMSGWSAALKFARTTAVKS